MNIFLHQFKQFYLQLMNERINQIIQYINFIKLMLLASLASTVLTVGLIIYDYKKNKQHKDKDNEKTSKKKYQTIKILLTGGPCGGKSQGINCIYQSFKSISAPVFIVPQAATIIGTAGLTLDLSQFKPRQIELFQIYLMRLQYNLEEIITSIANYLQKLQKKPIVLCDRGLLDGKAYAGNENWAKMLSQINITQKNICDRYIAVIHMVTAAKGAVGYYNYSNQAINGENNETQANNKVRRQTPAIAVDLDQKIQNCYKVHPNRYIISNEFFVKNFQDKKTVLLAQVYQILSQIIKTYNLSQYYNQYETSLRKNSEENINIMEHPSPYLIRKRKFQKFLRQNHNSLKSPERKIS